MAMSALADAQHQFTRALPSLFAYAWHVLGAEVALGEAWRSNEQAELNALGAAGRERVAQLVAAEFPELAKRIRDNGPHDGIRESLHGDRLALDLVLRTHGVEVPAAAYTPLGRYWTAQGPDFAWGGDFGDPGHFSRRFGGRQ
jgi:hypothetical protein